VGLRILEGDVGKVEIWAECFDFGGERNHNALSHYFQNHSLWEEKMWATYHRRDKLKGCYLQLPSDRYVFQTKKSKL